MSSPHRVQFQELADPQTLSRLEGKHIQIYGFTHQAQDGQWVISSSATLRSCCLARSIAQKESLRLTEAPSGIHDGGLALLEGTLYAQESSQESSQEGSHKEVTWSLQQPLVIKTQDTHHFIGSLFGIGLFSLILIYFLRSMLKRLSYT